MDGIERGLAAWGSDVTALWIRERCRPMSVRWWSTATLTCLALLAVACEEAPVHVEYEDQFEQRLGFSLETLVHYGDNAPDSLSVLICCPRYAVTMPVVAVNDSVLQRKGMVWESHHFACGALVTYRITWEGDTLSDSIIIPHGIDSLFFNDSLVEQPFITTNVDSGYHFRWHATGALSYQAEISLDLGPSYEFRRPLLDTVLTEPTVSVPAVYDTFHVTRVNLKLFPYGTLPLALDGAEPHAESERLYCYEELAGPRFSTAVFGE